MHRCSCRVPGPGEKTRPLVEIEKQTESDPVSFFPRPVLGYISRKGLCRVKLNTTPNM